MSPTPQGVIAVAVILPSFATVAVVLRFYVHRMKKLPLKSDAWTILAALVRRRLRPCAADIAWP